MVITVVKMNHQLAKTVQMTLEELKDSAARLDQAIVDPDTRELLLHSALESLHDVETFLLPQALKANPATAAMWLDAADFQLRSANKTLIHTHDLIAKYGPNLRVVGG